jgi:hypothetical protein
VPNFEQPIVVASLAALKDIHVAELDDGTLAYVQSLLSFFVLEKSNGGVDNGVSIIQPNAGSPIAGAAGARWVFLILAGSETLVTPFRIIPVPANSTSSAVFVDLMSASPVNVLTAGDILLDFDASIQTTPAPGAGTAQGVALQFLWDGAPLADIAFYQIDPAAPTAIDTFAETIRFRSLIVGAAPGAHTLSVQWLAIDPAGVVASFAGNGNLTIQTAPK